MKCPAGSYVLINWQELLTVEWLTLFATIFIGAAAGLLAYWANALTTQGRRAEAARSESAAKMVINICAFEFLRACFVLKSFIETIQAAKGQEQEKKVLAIQFAYDQLEPLVPVVLSRVELLSSLPKEQSAKFSRAVALAVSAASTVQRRNVPILSVDPLLLDKMAQHDAEIFRAAHQVIFRCIESIADGEIISASQVDQVRLDSANG